MSFNALNSLIAAVISALLSYGFWSYDGPLKNHIGIGSFVFFIGTLVPMIGLSYERHRLALNVRVLSGVFLAVALVMNSFFLMMGTGPSAYIIVSGVLFMLFLYLFNALSSARL